MFSFARDYQTVFQNSSTILHFPSIMKESSCYHYFFKHSKLLKRKVSLPIVQNKHTNKQNPLKLNLAKSYKQINEINNLLQNSSYLGWDCPGVYKVLGSLGPAHKRSSIPLIMTTSINQGGSCLSLADELTGSLGKTYEKLSKDKAMERNYASKNPK